ncbi:glycoprotein Xg-like isoform X2 [Tenrec ecaudatus]|uniref:glycoprotein Xg-like isoform X2 n=1 Tax=Tenrec ecaudatus TaxID=94439 RepID=UPI003F590651
MDILGRRAAPWVMLMAVLVLAVRGQRDFDLADALDDGPEPTKKPSPDVYPRPKPPAPRPQPGTYDNSGGYSNDFDHSGGHYPPRPRPPAGGGGHQPGYGGHGDTHGGGGYSTYDQPQGNALARIVSPVVSVLVVALVGAATSYLTYNRRRSCFRRNEPENV